MTVWKKCLALLLSALFICHPNPPAHPLSRSSTLSDYLHYFPQKDYSSLSGKRLGKAILYNSHIVKFLLMLKTLFLYIIQEEQSNFTAVRDKKYDLKDFSEYYKNFWRS